MPISSPDIPRMPERKVKSITITYEQFKALTELVGINKENNQLIEDWSEKGCMPNEGLYLLGGLRMAADDIDDRMTKILQEIDKTIVIE